MTKTICLSHKEDLDGLGSAALIRYVTDAEVVLADYSEQMEKLEKIATDKELDALCICDLGTSKTNEDRFAEILSSLCQRGVSVFYIDHHALSDTVAKRLSDNGVILVHDTTECTTMQAYNLFKEKLSYQHTLLATSAAVTDYMDDSPMASALIKMHDRQLILTNASMLCYCINGHQDDYDYLIRLCEMLAEGKMANQIPNVFEIAKKQMDNAFVTMNYVCKNYKMLDKVRYCETKHGMSGAVNFIPSIPGESVSVTYRDMDDDFYAVSVRGYVKTHLGKLLGIIAVELGGSGGGHPMACGAMIPKKNIVRFLEMLNDGIEL